MRPTKQTSLTYELPPTIESIKSGWQLTCQSGAIVSAVLSVVAIQLLSFLKISGILDEERDGIHTFLALSCYGSLFFNASASISGFVLIDRLGELTLHAAQKRLSLLPTGGTVEGNADDLLKRFGVGSLWTIIAWHWFFSYMAGIWCIILQVLTFLWLKESNTVKIAMTVLAGFSVLPLIAFFDTLFCCRINLHLY